MSRSSVHALGNKKRRTMEDPFIATDIAIIVKSVLFTNTQLDKKKAVQGVELAVDKLAGCVGNW